MLPLAKSWARPPGTSNGLFWGGGSLAPSGPLSRPRAVQRASISVSPGLVAAPAAAGRTKMPIANATGSATTRRNLELTTNITPE